MKFCGVGTLKNEFVIPFTGLKIGVHEFDFEVTTPFFEKFDFAIVKAGNVQVRLSLEKKETMLIGDFHLKGLVFTECDRCTDPVQVKVMGDFRLIYKFDTEVSLDETLRTVYPDEAEIDISEDLLEFITVSLPSRRVHKKKECNQEMIALLDKYRFGESEDEDEPDEVDPRWETLKKLK